MLWRSILDILPKQCYLCVLCDSQNKQDYFPEQEPYIGTHNGNALYLLWSRNENLCIISINFLLQATVFLYSWFSLCWPMRGIIWTVTMLHWHRYVTSEACQFMLHFSKFSWLASSDGLLTEYERVLTPGGCRSFYIFKKSPLKFPWREVRVAPIECDDF